MSIRPKLLVYWVLLGCIALAGCSGRSLRSSIVWGNDKAAREWMSREPSLIKTDKNLLHLAIYNGRTAIALELIERGADIQAADEGGNTPLLHAIDMRQPKIASALIARGARVNVMNDELDTPLLLLCRDMCPGAPKLARELLSRGARVSVRNVETPLGLALRDMGRKTVESGISESEAVAVLLVEHGADPNTRCPYDSSEGSSRGSALEVALQKNLTALARCLIRRGARGKSEETLPYAADPAILALLLRSAPPGVVGGRAGLAALIAAAESDSVECARMLIDHGADVNGRDSEADGKTPLHYAAKFDSAAVAGLLIRNGADVNARTENGWTPLHSAAEGSAPKVAELLIRRGADVNASLDRPVQWVQRYNYRGKLRESAESKGLLTPLDVAEAGRYHDAVVSVLRNAGAMPGSPTE